MTHWTRVSPLLLLMLLAPFAAAEDAADLVILDSSVITMNKVTPSTEAVALKGDKVLAVGSSEPLRKLIGPKTRVMQLRGTAVIPGVARMKDLLGDAPKKATLAEVLKDSGDTQSYSKLMQGMKSTLAAGNAADLMLLSTDPRTVIGDKVEEIEILMAIVGGQVVYRSPNLPDDVESIGPPTMQLAPGQRLVGKLGRGAGRENSGIVRSRSQDNVYWTVNDSGNLPRIHAVKRDGVEHRQVPATEEPGTLIPNSTNRDWEDIDILPGGTIVVADTGNNKNARQDLRLYLIREPQADAAEGELLKTVQFRYPDQKEFPAPRTDFNFDCEAIFTIGEQVYFLTKHRSDTATKAYRLSDLSEGKVHDLELLDRCEMQSQVVAADASPDGSKLVVMTYERIWLFDVKDPSRPLAHPVARFPYKGEQVEAVCFDGPERVLFSDEATALVYEARLEDFETFSP